MRIHSSLLNLLLIPLLIACGSNSGKTAPKVTVSYEDSLLGSKEFISKYSKLSEACRSFLDNKIEVYYRAAETDSIYAIYAIEARFFEPHYEQDESDQIEKFAGFMKTSTDTTLFFFGIDQQTSDFLFLHELKTNGSTILTKEEHYRRNTSFDYLAKEGCLDLNLVDGLEILEMDLSLSTFEHDSSRTWKVDSVLYDDEKLSIFPTSETFKVSNNRLLKFEEFQMEILYEDWQAFFIIGKDSTPTRILSYSRNGRILEESKIGSLVFLSRLDK